MGCVSISIKFNTKSSRERNSKNESQSTTIINHGDIHVIPHPIIFKEQNGNRKGIHLSRAQAMNLYDQIFEDWEEDLQSESNDEEHLGEGGAVSCSSDNEYSIKKRKKCRLSCERSRSITSTIILPLRDSTLVARRNSLSGIKKRNSTSLNLKRRHSLSAKITNTKTTTSTNSSTHMMPEVRQRRSSCILYQIAHVRTLKRTPSYLQCHVIEPSKLRSCNQSQRSSKYHRASSVSQTRSVDNNSSPMYISDSNPIYIPTRSPVSISQDMVEEYI